MPRRLISLTLILLLALFMVWHPAQAGFIRFKRSLNQRPYGYQVVPDPTGQAPTAQVERFEVRPGDCMRSKHWDDCATDRERSELSEKAPWAEAGNEVWYGWYFYLPHSHPNIYPAVTTLGQFHQSGSHVLWLFQQWDRGLILKEQVSGRAGLKYPLIPECALRGAWHRMEVQARWSRGEDGVFKVWINGKLKVRYSGPTMSAKTVYFKYGVYRSFLSRYKQKPHNGPAPAQVAYFAGVKRGRSRADLKP